ncbi:class I SAM-dependent methyltransferase [Leptolyngbya sp. NK1-12]|uniref:Class I SAM-dependent methyltransferase n=1 Tax=Leptolyngbya sp. NK1-12 TaxID=2547451 RepID=A0AA96WEC1_9CYAN|nr:class I SAM-dependent methyltransferase [Leptolyngbya sp. NK1-12]WNZ23753.1 class I SAM-dependent methyltransferase [Leptolyngbya sp. NK1-12]
MATILREWSYRYPWFYDGVIRLAALTVGGETKFRQLALDGLEITPDLHLLDLCCGDGQATRFLVTRSAHVIGFDASPIAIERANQNVPEAKYVRGWAEAMPFEDQQFDLVHVSLGLHEMRPVQLWRIMQEVHRVLKPGGVFTLIDFYVPVNWLYSLGLNLFLLLFETETAWQFIKTDLLDLSARVGFQEADRTLYAGGSLQVVHARKGTQ